MKQHNYYIYILTTSNNKVMYVGVTNDLQRRIYEHQYKLIDGFTKKHNITKLVYYESTKDVNSATQREKEIKKWRREKKNRLVESLNPNWNDLGDSLFNEISQSTKNSLLRNDKYSVSGLIIAAGYSSRMGKFKPLLQFQNKSFLHNIVNKLDSICDEVVVVTGHKKVLIEAELKSFPNKNKIKHVFNKNYQEGMFTSLQTGLEHLVNHNWVLYHFVDQPNLPTKFYRELVTQIDNSIDWIQPNYRGKNGHPILMSKKAIDLIVGAPQNSNLKELTTDSKIAKKYWKCNYPEIHDDIDTFERYNKLPK